MGTLLGWPWGLLLSHTTEWETMTTGTIEDVLSKLDPEVAIGARDFRLVDAVRARFRKQMYKQVVLSTGDFPEIIVQAPNTWPYVYVGPFYDVHRGNSACDEPLFKRHLEWGIRTPNFLTWDGGDAIENNTKLSVGTGIYEQDYSPQNQIVRACLDYARIRHKMMFKLEGNHEARSAIVGLSAGQWMAQLLDRPFFPDYAMLTIRFRGNNFRILAHHGTGAANTAGGIAMAARKDIQWARPFDIFWTGHLHKEHVEGMAQTDIEQATGRVHERNGFVIVSKSYLKYFGTWAASKRMSLGTRGMTVVKLMPDGRIDADLHANGRRF